MTDRNPTTAPAPTPRRQPEGRSITRRAALAGAAAPPALSVPALSLPVAAAAPQDPAIAAVRRWLAANLNERAYNDPDIPDDDPHAEALYEQEERLWQAMMDTPPQAPYS